MGSVSFPLLQITLHSVISRALLVFPILHSPPGLWNMLSFANSLTTWMCYFLDNRPEFWGVEVCCSLIPGFFPTSPQNTGMFSPTSTIIILRELQKMPLLDSVEHNPFGYTYTFIAISILSGNLCIFFCFVLTGHYC